jgi:general secretion pathway protein E
MKIGEYLVGRGFLTKEQLDIVLKEQEVVKEPIGRIMVRMGFIKRHVLFTVIANLNPSALIGDSDIEVDIPSDVLISTESMLLGDTESDLYVASLNSDPGYVVNELKKHIDGDRNIKLVPIDYGTITKYLTNLKNKISPNKQIDKDSGDINKIISGIIDSAIDNRATDIHIETSEKSIHLRVRIDGILKLVNVLPLSIRDTMFSRIKDMSGMDISEKRTAQDGSFSFEYKNRMVDIRVSTMPTAYGEKITIRILDKEKLLLNIHELGITQIDKWIDLSRITNGLILVCGATGSGKTTTLYSTVKSMDTLKKSIYMIEEPIEYRIPLVTQVQVNRKTNLDYASFLRAVLRHDPDICVIGEIRDRETVENALRLADTGHLVYATLHTNDVPSSIIRLIDLGADKLYLKFLLRGIMVQKLLRKLCTVCAGNACDACNDGYKGMTLVSEFVAIEHPDDIDAILGGRKKYQTFKEDLKRKLESGITDVKEVERVTGFKVVKVEGATNV